MGKINNIKEGHLEELADSFKVFSDPLRLKIIRTLNGSEKCVNELVEETGARQSNISKHLGVLTDHGMVERRRMGLYVYYKISDNYLIEALRYAFKRSKVSSG